MAKLLSVILTALLAPISVSAALYERVIKTQYGDIQGYPAFNSSPIGNLTHWRDITVWKGIPFSGTTAGLNRFREPQPASPWNDTLDTSDWGPICPSATSGPTKFTIDENCLNLNIWSAANSTDARLPVVMWSNPAQSTAADVLFNGGGMADKGIVFVNYNYRTGSFGWLAHPELTAEFYKVSGSNSSGNWSMSDQFAALKWIRENIAAFGGDPEHITVMGQSAGSAASQHILNSPLTKGQIVGAIIENGVRDIQDPLCSSVAEAYITLEASEAEGIEYLASLNVSTVAELRSLPMDDLITASGGLNGDAEWMFSATLDYYAMPDTYYNTLVKGLAHNVPIITGNAKDENGAVYGINITVAEYLANMTDSFSGKWLERFLVEYPASTSQQARGAFNAQWTERSTVGTWLWAQLWATARTAPVYTYFWDHAPPGQDQGAYHESEINYVLNNLYDTTDLPWMAKDYWIADQMNSYWVNFIKTGNPNGVHSAGRQLVEWAATNSTEVVQHVGNGWGPIPIASQDKIDLFGEWFETLPYF
ncbi:uncharacterized protein N7483_000860 [Penicillium malachiteum]|uniref:uncharacterized protein n=1 Tax=Penicillium malachiteum TaxID=1324776 RepID=UPI0025465FB9|nr:uncharacterized protein N7483_000860 [Penicillium malachiteum]KAJ5735735.1 hypothetical protein N7483_000860 [Penicillium malachiteum]